MYQYQVYMTSITKKEKLATVHFLAVNISQTTIYCIIEHAENDSEQQKVMRCTKQKVKK